MGSYAELWTSTDSSPLSDVEALGYICSKWYVPSGWLALFEPNDFLIETLVDEEHGESNQALYSSTTVPKAISLLRERSGLFTQVGGERWDKGMQYFMQFLSEKNAHYIHAAYVGLSSDDFPPLVQRQFYIEQIKNIKPPVFIEKKGFLFGTKIKLSEHWRHLVPEDYKKNTHLPYWKWFGAPPGNKEDWDD